MNDLHKTLDLDLLRTFATMSNLSNQDNRHRTVMELAKFFRRLIVDVVKPDFFIEVGAYDAGFSRRAKPFLSNTKFFAFEANPHNHEKFKPLVNASNIEYVYSAISNHTGTVTLNLQRSIDGKNVAPVRGNNSLLERTQEGVEYEKVAVPCDTIDNYFSQSITPENTVAMWVDVEGMAYQVFSGAESILSRTKVILVELEDYRYWNEQHLATDVIKQLYHEGFLPIARDFETPHQYNVIFAHQNLINDPSFREAYAQYLSCLQKNLREWRWSDFWKKFKI